jgi:hypothetical protein
LNNSGEQLPGGRSEDVSLAINNPDEYAWRLFLAINRQAANGKIGEPDPKFPITRYTDDSPVVWETWALASGGRHSGTLANPPVNYSEVYLNDGAEPLEWGKWPRGMHSIKAFEVLPAQIADELAEISGRKVAAVTFSMAPTSALFSLIESKLNVAPSTEEAEGNEVRMNRPTYDFIRMNGLYNVEGLEAEFVKETATVKPSPPLSFPVTAQEIKAQWRPIRPEDKPRYHWRALRGSDGKPKTYGLVALHIMTKDLPNWFWCTFVQEDYDKYPEMDSFDSTTKNSVGVRAEVVGSKWEHYRLRGSQIDFTDSRGRYTVLANPVIEHGFQQTASCITCHSRASVGLRPPDAQDVLNKLDPLKIDNLVSRGTVMVGPVGPMNPQWFMDEKGKIRYIQTDFVWSASIRALSKNSHLYHR